MFAATARAEALSAALDPVSALVNECKIRIPRDSLEIRAVDPANVGMIDMSLSVDAFDSYQADGGVLGVNLERLLNVVGMAEDDDVVHLQLDGETRKLHIDIDGLSYTLALIDPESIREEPDIPDLDLPCMAAIKGRDISRAVTAADMVSDHVRLHSDGDAFYVSAEGDTDDVKQTLSADELMSVSEALADADSLFSLDYLQDMAQPMTAETEVRIELGQEFPVKLHYDIADGAGQVTNMLAPRIQSE